MNRGNGNQVHVAVMSRSLPDLVQAIEHGQDVDALDREGRTALFYACKNGDMELVEELIKHGADVSAQDRNQKSPLHFAASAYQVGIVDLLTRSGANVDIQDAHGNTPLSDAVYDSKGRGDVIRLLLARGADKSAKNKYGISPEALAKSIANYDVSQFVS